MNTMKTKASIIIFLTLLASFNSPGQSPADLISYDDSVSLANRISEVVSKNNLCKQNEYSVIYCYRMEYSGENVVEDINKNTLIKNVVFSYSQIKGFLKNKKCLQVVAYIFGPNYTPLAIHCTYAIPLGHRSRKPMVSKVSPGSDEAQLMRWLATLQISNKESFIFDMSLNEVTPIGYYFISTDSGMTYFRSTKDGWKEITKEEYFERILSDKLIFRS